MKKKAEERGRGREQKKKRRRGDDEINTRNDGLDPPPPRATGNLEEPAISLCHTLKSDKKEMQRTKAEKRKK